jgi:acyl carrier protein
MDIEGIVLDTLASISGKPRATLSVDTPLGSGVVMDSLEFVEAVMKIEEVVGIELPDGETAKLKSIGELVALCERLKAEADASA